MRDTSATVQLLDDDLVFEDSATQVDISAYEKTRVFTPSRPVQDDAETPVVPRRSSRLWMLPASLVLVCAGMLLGLLTSRRQQSAPVIVVSPQPTAQQVTAPPVPPVPDVAVAAATAAAPTAPATVGVTAVSRPSVRKPGASTHSGHALNRVFPGETPTATADAPRPVVAAAPRVDATAAAANVAPATPPKKETPPVDNVSSSAIDKELKAAL